DGSNSVFHLATGGTTINSSGPAATFYLGSGDTTINSNGFGADVIISSGKTILNGSFYRVTIPDTSTINVNNVFTGSANSSPYLVLNGGSDINLANLHLNNNWLLYINYSEGTVAVDNSVLSHLNYIYGYNNAKLQTSAAVLDLTKTPVANSITI